MGMNSALTAQDAKKRAVGAKALRFVYPDIAGQIREENVDDAARHPPEAAAQRTRGETPSRPRYSRRLPGCWEGR